MLDSFVLFVALGNAGCPTRSKNIHALMNEVTLLLQQHQQSQPQPPPSRIEIIEFDAQEEVDQQLSSFSSLPSPFESSSSFSSSLRSSSSPSASVAARPPHPIPVTSSDSASSSSSPSDSPSATHSACDDEPDFKAEFFAKRRRLMEAKGLPMPESNSQNIPPSLPSSSTIDPHFTSSSSNLTSSSSSIHHTALPSAATFDSVPASLHSPPIAPHLARLLCTNNAFRRLYAGLRARPIRRVTAPSLAEFSATILGREPVILTVQQRYHHAMCSTYSVILSLAFLNYTIHVQYFM